MEKEVKCPVCDVIRIPSYRKYADGRSLKEIENSETTDKNKK